LLDNVIEDMLDIEALQGQAVRQAMESEVGAQDSGVALAPDTEGIVVAGGLDPLENSCAASERQAKFQALLERWVTAAIWLLRTL